MRRAQAIASGLALALGLGSAAASQTAIPFEQKLDGWTIDTPAERREASLRCFALSDGVLQRLPDETSERRRAFEALQHFYLAHAVAAHGGDPASPGPMTDQMLQGATLVMERYRTNGERGMTLGFEDLDALLRDDFRVCASTFEAVVRAAQERNDG